MGLWKRLGRCPRVLLLLAIAEALTFWFGASLLAGETGSITLEQIERAWEERQQQFESGRIAWSATRFMAKGAIAGESKPDPFDAPAENARAVPPEDTRHEFACELKFDGNKLRYTHNAPQWVSPLKKFWQTEMVMIYDGQVSGRLASESFVESFPSQGRTKAGPSMITGLLAVRPVLQHFRPEAAAIEYLKKWNVTAERESFDGSSCIVLARRTFTGVVQSMWLDPDSGFTVRKWVNKYGSVVRSQCDVFYNEDTQYGDVLAGWKRAEYSPDGTLRRSVDAKVTDMELNVALAPADFVVEYPADTLVVDETSSDTVSSEETDTYLVLRDGERRPVTGAEMRREGLTPAVLAATKPGEAGGPQQRGASYWVWIATGVVLLSGCGIYAVRRWRRSQVTELG